MPAVLEQHHGFRIGNGPQAVFITRSKPEWPVAVMLPRTPINTRPMRLFRKMPSRSRGRYPFREPIHTLASSEVVTGALQPRPWPRLLLIADLHAWVSSRSLSCIEIRFMTGMTYLWREVEAQVTAPRQGVFDQQRDLVGEADLDLAR